LFISNLAHRALAVALASLLAAAFILSVSASVALVACLAGAAVCAVLLLIFALSVEAALLKREAW
jgi:hypothetical protein